jgi:uncharacterized protein (DUF2141 family)
MRIVLRIAIIATVVYLTLPLVGAFPQEPKGTNSSATPGAGCTLRIHVDGLRNSKGNLGTVLYTSADGWPENPKKAFRSGPAPIPTGQRQATAVWENLPPGNYGVAAIHDENSNAKLDRNFLGIPKEGFGFANNPHVWLGPASFEQALVHVTCPVTETTIHLQYK